MIRIYIIILTIFLFTLFSARADQLMDPPTVTFLDNPSPGYVLFDWKKDTPFSLMDNYGEFVHPSNSSAPNRLFKLLNNGKYAQLSINKYLIYNQDLILVDSVLNPTDMSIDFHDFISLSNGHYLLLCNYEKEVDLSAVVEGGKKDARILNCTLVETDGHGTIFWQWSILNHCDVREACPDVDLTQQVIDFAHVNSMSEDPDGNILISIRNFDLIALINKKTGDFLWKMGGRESKDNQFTFLNDNVDGFIGFSHQHCVNFLPNGNILMFDNGNLKVPEYSRAVEYTIDTTAKTVSKVWEYRCNPDLFSGSMGSAYRLENGNTLIAFTTFKILEVRPDGTPTLEITFPDGYTFYRAQKITSQMDYKSLNISSADTFDFNDAQNITGVQIIVDKYNGQPALVHLQKHYYPPHSSDFVDTTFNEIFPYRWVLSPDIDVDEIEGKISIDASTLQNIGDPKKIVIYKRDKETIGDFRALRTRYFSTTGDIAASFSGFGEFVIGSSFLFEPVLLRPYNTSFADVSGVLIWRTVKNAKNYRVQMAKDGHFDEIVFDTLLAVTNRLEYSDLGFNQRYHWRVQALNETDTSDWSEPFYFVTHLSAPVLLLPLKNFIGHRIGDIMKWSQVDGAESYQVQLSLSEDFDSIVVDTNIIKDNYFYCNSMLYNTLYFWRVRAFKDSDSSSWSQVDNFVTNIATPEPIKPRDNSVKSKDSIILFWAKVSGAETYRIEISDNISYKDPVIFTFKQKDTSLFLSGLDYETHYYWHVKSIRLTDSSDWSPDWSFTTKEYEETIVLDTPKIIYPDNSAIAVPIEGVIKWDPVENATSYIIAFYKNESKDTMFIDNITLTSFAYQDLEYGAIYYFKILASNENVESEWSSPVSFITELEPPVIIYPEDFSKDVPVKGEILWDIKNNTNFYHIQIARDSKFSDVIDEKSNYSDLAYSYSLFDKATYFCRVKSHNDTNYSVWSPIVEFTTEDLSGIVDSKNDFDFFIYPNPANDFVYIEINDNSLDKSIEIIDLLGRRQKEYILNSNLLRIRIDDLQSGVYFVKISNKCKIFLKE